MKKTYKYNNHANEDFTLQDGDIVVIIDERGHEEDWFSEVRDGRVTLPDGDTITLDDLETSDMYDIEEMVPGK